jgi:hypothetical protein
MSNDKIKHMTKLHEFDALRKTDPRLYWSPAVQSTMHRLAQEQGEKFFTSSASSGSERRHRMEALAREWEELSQRETNTEGETS